MPGLAAGQAIQKNDSFVSESEMPMIDDAGNVVFVAQFGPTPFSTQLGLFRARPGEIEAIAYPGQPVAPAGWPAGSQITSFASPSVSSNGDVTFTAGVRYPSTPFPTNQQAVWSGPPGQMRIIASTGPFGPGPGLGPDYRFGGMIFPFINATGQVAFRGTLVGPGVNNSNRSGIWATDMNGDLHMVIRDGQELDIDDGPGIELKTVTSAELINSSPNSTGLGASFNERGEFALFVNFTDGSRAVVVSDTVAVPEPRAIVLCVAPVLFVAIARRRRVNSRARSEVSPN